MMPAFLFLVVEMHQDKKKENKQEKNSKHFELLACVHFYLSCTGCVS